MAARHLVLIGLMGAGKTTVGERCADLLGRAFLDTDQLVEANTRMGVADIFQHHGEQQFRVLERDAVADARRVARPARHRVRWRRGARSREPPPPARLRPRRLVARVARGARRTRRHRRRPSPARGAAPPSTTLARLSAQREPAYEAAADVQVDTEGRRVDEVAAAVVQEYQAWNG